MRRTLSTLGVHPTVPMRWLVLPLFLVLALSAQSQPLRSAAPARLDSGPRRVVTAAGAAGAVGAAGLAYLVIESGIGGSGGAAGSATGILIIAGSYAAGMLLATRLAGSAYGADASWPASGRDILLALPAGALAGIVAGGLAAGTVQLILLAADDSSDGSAFAPAFAGGFVGVPVALWVSSRVAGRSLRVDPAMLAAPTGETGTGVTLRLGL